MNTPHNYNETDTERSNTMFSTGTALNDIAFRIVATAILTAAASLILIVQLFASYINAMPGGMFSVYLALAVLSAALTRAIFANRVFEAAKQTVASDEAVFEARVAAYSIPAIEVFPAPAHASVKAHRELVTVGA